MARYVFRLSVLGPRALTPAEIATVVQPVFLRYGFRMEGVSVSNTKGLAPPVLRPFPDDPSRNQYVVTVPSWGPIELGDDSAWLATLNLLVQYEVPIEGELPPTSASGATGAAQLSGAVYDAMRAAFDSPRASPRFYTLQGSRYAAGLVRSGGGGGGALALLGLGAVAMIMYSRPTTGRGTPLFGLGRTPPARQAARLRKRAQRYRHEGRYLAARHLEKQANRISH